jgi:hypothetical protein
MGVYNSQSFENIPGGGHRITSTVLAARGPIIDVSVSIPQAIAAFYTKQQMPLPSPVTGIAMIDTGATRSCVHDSIMKDLKVNPIGIATAHTAAGPTLQNLYPAHFTFPATNIKIDFTSVAGVDLSGQIIEGQQLIALIGRDVLSLGILVYNGPYGIFGSDSI